MKTKVLLEDYDVRLEVKTYLEGRGHKVEVVETFVHPAEPGNGSDAGRAAWFEVVVTVENRGDEPPEGDSR